MSDETKLKEYETKLHDGTGADSLVFAVGVDECGMGAFAGPMVACCAYVPPNVVVKGVRDSKKLSVHDIKHLSHVLAHDTPGVVYETGHHSATFINKCGSELAWDTLMSSVVVSTIRHICKANVSASHLTFHVLIDGGRLPRVLQRWAKHINDQRKTTQRVHLEAIPKGDATCYCIAVASIMAKDFQIRYMEKAAKTFPLYGFEQHHGYGTQMHRDVLDTHGTCVEHRNIKRNKKKRKKSL